MQDYIICIVLYWSCVLSGSNKKRRERKDRIDIRRQPISYLFVRLYSHRVKTCRTDIDGTAQRPGKKVGYLSSRSVCEKFRDILRRPIP